MQKKQPKCPDMTKLSKRLSWLLRHGAIKEGLHLQSDGFISVQEILQHPNYKNCFSMEILNRLVENDQKQRYTLRFNKELGDYEIRANQGHTLAEVQDDKCLQPIFSVDEVPLAVHGTFLKHWPSIKREGLNRMSRNHVHFATSESQSYNVIGFRSDCQILIYLDVAKVLECAELKLYRSDNNVILCSGLQDGSIPTKYFKKIVERRTGRLLDF